jgi:1-phosphofructokinase
MIVTLTLNPSLDRAIEVDELRRGAVIRAASAHLDPGGEVVTSRSSVGAGDALLAGFLAGGGHGPAALAEALAWGAAAVGLPGSRMPTTADIRRAIVHLHDVPDLTRSLASGADQGRRGAP